MGFRFWDFFTTRKVARVFRRRTGNFRQTLPTGNTESHGPPLLKGQNAVLSTAFPRVPFRAFSTHRGCRPIFQLCLSVRSRTMHAAKDLPAFLHAMPNDPATATRTLRRQGVNRAFETVEDMPFFPEDNLEGLVIFIPANFALSHGRQMWWVSAEAQNRSVRAGRYRGGLPAAPASDPRPCVNRRALSGLHPAASRSVGAAQIGAALPAP